MLITNKNTAKLFLVGIALCKSTAAAWPSDSCKGKVDPKANKLETFSVIQNTLCQEGDAVVKAIVDLDDATTSDNKKKRQKSPVKSLWQMHAQHVESHLDASDKFLFPKLSTAFGFEKLKDAKVVQQSHKRIRHQIKDISQSISSLEKTKDDTSYQQTLQAVKSKLQQYPKVLQEETTLRANCILPSAQKSISKQDWGDLMREYIAAGGVNLGAMVHFMSEPTFRKEYLKAKGVPSFVWHVAFKGPYKKFQTQFSNQLKALEA